MRNAAARCLRPRRWTVVQPFVRDYLATLLGAALPKPTVDICKEVIFPMTAFRVMLKSLDETYAELLRTGTQAGILDRMRTRMLSKECREAQGGVRGGAFPSRRKRERVQDACFVRSPRL